MPQQSEICVKFSVFHTRFWREILVKFSRTYPTSGRLDLQLPGIFLGAGVSRRFIEKRYID